MGELVSAGVGTSIEEDSFEAGNLAAGQAVEQAGGVDFGFVFASTKYNLEELMKGVQKILGAAKFLGCSSALELTNSGLHQNSVTVMAISSDHMRLGVGVGTNAYEDPRNAGREAILSALKDVKMELYSAPLAALSPERMELMKFNPYTVLIFPFGATAKKESKEEEIIEGMMDVVGTKFPILGATASDMRAVETYQFCNGKAYTDSVVCGILGSDVRVGFGLKHGYSSTGKIATVTESQGRMVHKINGKPAVSGYAEMIDMDVNELKEKLGSPLTIAGINPLGQQDMKGHQWLKVPLLAWDDSIMFSSRIHPNTILSLMESDNEQIINSAGECVKSACAEVGTNQISAILVFNCVLREVRLGKEGFQEDGKHKIVENIKKFAGEDIPIIGFAAQGEIGSTRGGITDLHAHNIVSMVFSDVSLPGKTTMKELLEYAEDVKRIMA